MEKKLKGDMRIIMMLKALLSAYVVTGGLLLVLAAMLYKMNLDEQKVSFGIIAIYVISTFVGGLVIGKLAGQRRFVWGMIFGVCYFLLLLLISLGVYRTFQGNAANMITIFLLCVGGGMMGGMVS